MMFLAGAGSRPSYEQTRTGRRLTVSWALARPALDRRHVSRASERGSEPFAGTTAPVARVGLRDMRAAASGREPSTAIGAPKRFMDENGTEWTVSERDASTLPGARGARCLIFQSSEAVRRVWDYPAGWRELLTSGLITLSWER